MEDDGVFLGRYIRENDRRAFEELVRRYSGLVYGICLRVTGNLHDAEDASQECFLELARNPRSVTGSLVGWLHLRAISRARDVVKRVGRRQRREQQAASSETVSAEPSWETLAPALDVAVAELPDELRMPLVLHYFQGRKQHEVAAELGVGQSAISRRLSKGVDVLRIRLRQAGVTVSVGALVSLMASHSTAAAVPAALAASLSQTALGGIGGGTAIASTTTVAGAAGGTVTGGIGIVKLSLLGLAAAAAITTAVVVTQVGGQENATPQPVTPVQSNVVQAQPEDEPVAQEPRIWHILRQVDTQHLTFGLPPRLEEVKADRNTIAWKGIENGCTMTLDINVEDRWHAVLYDTKPVEGEIVVGFFADPRWWLAPPLQVRSFPGPGRYTVENLIPGKYCLGAMIESGWEPNIALGCHSTWPDSVEISPDITAEAQLLVSAEIRHEPSGGFRSEMQKAFCGRYNLEAVDPERLVTIRTVEGNGTPVPFCHLIIREGAERKYPERHTLVEAATDWTGLAFQEVKEGPWLAEIQALRFDFLPDSLLQRWLLVPQPDLFDIKPPALITTVLEDFPTGTATVRGRVHDQYARPVKEYYITFRNAEGDPNGIRYGCRLPVMDAEGRFEITGMPGGLHRFTVRAFDYPTYDFNNNDGEIDIPREPNATVDGEIELEAKSLWYGKAVYEDGTAVYPGTWTAPFEQAPVMPWGRYTGFGMNPDGTFRVSLTRQELDDFRNAANGMVEVKAIGDENFLQHLGKVSIDKLSTDPNQPTRLAFPRPAPPPPPR